MSSKITPERAVMKDGMTITVTQELSALLKVLHIFDSYVSKPSCIAHEVGRHPGLDDKKRPNTRE